LTDIYAPEQYLNLHTRCLSNSSMQNLPCEVFSHLSCQEISCLFMESEISRETIMGPVLSYGTGIQFHIMSLRSFNNSFQTYDTSST
jgi:hypothetical protein